MRCKGPPTSAANPALNNRSSSAKKAASVLPEPVGAAISVCAPDCIAGQPRCCGSVGDPNFCSNQREMTGWNRNWFMYLLYPMDKRGATGDTRISGVNTNSRTQNDRIMAGQNHAGSEQRRPMSREIMIKSKIEIKKLC